MDADHLVVACPAWAAGELLCEVDGRLASLLRMIPYTSSAIAQMVFRASEFDGQRAGTGFLVPRTERKRLMACTFVGTKFPHRVPADKITLRCFFGGAGNDAVLAESDESLIAIAREELADDPRPDGHAHLYRRLPLAAVHGAIHRRPRRAAERNRVARRGCAGIASGRQRLYRYRHPGLHSHGPQGCLFDHSSSLNDGT